MNKFVMSYPDFRLGDIIDPDEANTNSADITYKFDEIIDTINSLIGTGDGGVIKVTIKGDIVTINPIGPFESDNVEDLLNELITRLQSTVKDSSGAGLIGTEAIVGLEGNTVVKQLQEIYVKLTELKGNTYNKGDINNMFEPILESLNPDNELLVLGRIEVREADPLHPAVGRIWITKERGLVPPDAEGGD